MAVSPYLFFDGACREAMTAYAEILHGEITMMMTASDAPEGEGMDGADPQSIMHAQIKVGRDTIMGSDDAPGRNVAPASTHVMAELPDVGAARQAFDRLAEGGEVRMPFDKTFWSDGFGVVRDRWGQLWMIGVEVPE